MDGLLSSLSLQERRRISWKRLYKEISQLGSLSCTKLMSKDGIFPRPRASHSLNFVSDYLVLFGGGCERGRHLDDTWVAYVGGNQCRRVLSWKRIHSGTPSGRFGQTCTVVGDTLVLFGGINDNGVRQNDTWIGSIGYEASLDITVSWRLLDNVGPVAPPPRGAHAACFTGDQSLLVIHGGIGLYGLRLGDTWLLDLSNGLHSARWHQVTSIRPSPPSRSGHTLTCIGGARMVLFGGRSSGYEVLNDLWVFDLSGDQPRWTELKYDLLSNIMEMPSPRVGHSANLILGGKILIYGGENSQRQRKDDLWLLDVSALLKVSAMIWKTASAREMWKKLRVEDWAPGHRAFHGACTDTSGRYIYIFGGMVDGVLQPGEAYGMRFDGELFLVELVLEI